MGEIITSVQNKTIKERAKLHKKKERDRQSLFIVEGKHLIEEANTACVLKELYLSEGTKDPDFTISPVYCSRSVMQKLSNQVSQASMIGICEKKQNKASSVRTALFLDGIQDPGNLGTLFRSGYSFGLDAIYLSDDCADIYNPKSIQASQGALFHIPFAYVDLEAQIKTCQANHMHVYATALHTDTRGLQQIIPPCSYGILLGNEGNGVQQALIDLCDETIQIEMHAFESLNVAVAGSILMYTLQYK